MLTDLREFGIFMTVKARFWPVYDSQGQILALIRQSRPDSGLAALVTKEDISLLTHRLAEVQLCLR